MKNHTLRLIIFVSLILLVCSGISWAADLSSADLIAHAKDYNAKTIVYRGEVIGDVMLRGDHAWINIHDGVNAIGVWVNAALVKDIQFGGSYKSAGDKVEITGIFNHACLEHGGDLDIHGQAIRMIKAGEEIKRLPDKGKINLAIVLCGVIISLWILTLFLRK